ncbi:hypothetical protein V8F06_013073 [Rhypophila decipiens]
MQLSQALPVVILSACSVVASVNPVTVFTLPGPVKPSSWFENLVVRPNGRILATRGDAPEIWQINPSTGAGEMLVSLPPSTGAFNLTGISRVHMGDGDEIYVFGSSHIPAPLQVTPGSAKVWTLEMANSGSASVSLLASIPAAGFLNGIAEWGRNGRVLISDTEREAVYLMDVATGSFTTPLTNLTGINGIKTVGPTHGSGCLYRADHMSLTLSRIPIDAATATALGPAELLADQQLIDDFSLKMDKHGDTGKAYLGTMYDNSVVEVAFGSQPSSELGVKTPIATNLTGTGFGLCTVTVFGRGRNKDKLYAAVGQGGGSAQIVVLDLS